MIERVADLPCSFSGSSPGLLLLGALGLNAPCSVIDGKAAEFVGLSPD